MSSPSHHPSIEALLGESEWAWKLARSLVSDPAAADDVVQDAIKSAVERPPDFTAEGNTPRGWLSTVIRALVAKRHRGEQRRSVREEWSAKVEALPPAERMLEREEQRRNLIQSVLALSEPYRDVLLLRYFEDLTPTEIAARLDCPVKTVKSRLARALEQLRERLQARRDEHGLDGLSALALWIPAVKPLFAVGTGTKLVAALAFVLAGAAALWFAWPEREELASVPIPAIRMFAATPAQGEQPAGIPTRAEAAQTSVSTAQALDFGQRVRVVFDGSLAPAANATVSWRTIEAGGVRGPLASGTTDAAGELEFERPAGQLELAAQWPGWFAEARLRDADVEPLELVLAPDGDLLVQVRFASGAPAAGLEVAAGRGGSSRVSPSTAFTDDAGLAVFEHFRARQFRGNSSDGLVWIAPLALVSGGPLHVESVAVWPNAPLALTVPDGASLHVRVVDEVGAPVLEPVRLSVAGLRDSLPPHFEIRDGETWIHGVEPGLKLALLVSPLQRASFTSSGVNITAPPSRGEQAEVTLVLANQSPVVAGRLLGPGGAPFASAKLDIVAREHLDQPWDPGRSTFRTDEAGRFEGPTTRIVAEAPVDTKLLFRSEDGRLEATLDLGAPLDAGVPLELGDVQLAPAPPLVAGLVVDSEGRPLANATVELHTRPAGTTLRRIKDVPRTVRTDAFGKFELYAGITSGELQLVARLGTYLDSVARDVQVGETSVVLVLARPTLLAGRLVVGNPNVLDALELECGATKVQPALDGTFRLAVAEAKAGSTLRVLLQGHAQPLLELASLQGPDDPRLRTLDLTGLVTSIVATVVDSTTGEPLQRVDYLWSTATAQRSLQIGRGCIGAVVVGSTADFVVRAEGYAEHKFVGVRHGDVLRLRR